jgi:hypothetical protein
VPMAPKQRIATVAIMPLFSIRINALFRENTPFRVHAQEVGPN